MFSWMAKQMYKAENDLRNAGLIRRQQPVTILAHATGLSLRGNVAIWRAAYQLRGQVTPFKRIVGKQSVGQMLITDYMLTYV
jgi:hypothetical protein